MAKNRKCICCGKEYHFCPNCGKSARKPSWMTLYCSETCKNLFQVLNDYNFGLISRDEAKELLSGFNTSDSSLYKENIYAGIREILDDEVEDITE